MGLISSVNIALSGIRNAQENIDLISRNVANAGTPGYTRKILPQENALVGDTGAGVRSLAARRQIDAFLQQQIRTEVAATEQLDIRRIFLSRIDRLFGKPEDAASIAGMLDKFGTSLQKLSNQPASSAVRQQVVSEAAGVAANLNAMTHAVQGMRLEAENNIASHIDEINGLLSSISRINIQISQRNDGSVSAVDLEDERDKAIDALSKLMDVRVVPQGDGTLNVFTSSGFLLVDKSAITLRFDGRNSMDPGSLYSTDPARRTVGTISAVTGTTQVDLIAAGAFDGGKIGGYLELRDSTLVETQKQLDELAASLALAFSEETLPSTAVTAGAASGFEIDIASIRAGNPVHLDYTLTPPGTPVKVTIIPVNDPATLPLDNSATPDPDDQVIGINFNQPIADIVTDLNAALPAGFSVSTPSGTMLRIMDDGAGGTLNINTLSATITPDALTGAGKGLPVFTDTGGVAFTNARDGQIQRTGFAGRIQLNTALRNDISRLVVFESGTAAGDNARPLELLNRLQTKARSFHPDTGIGGAQSPFSGSVLSYARRVISFQSGQAETAIRDHGASRILSEALQEKFSAETGVNVDQEMSSLLVLQNAYAANARVLSVVQDLFGVLMRIGR